MKGFTTSESHQFEGSDRATNRLINKYIYYDGVIESQEPSEDIESHHLSLPISSGQKEE